MPIRYPVELQGVLDGTVPAVLANGFAQGGRVTRRRATIVLAASGNGLLTQNDWALLCRAKAGESFCFGLITASATMGASAQIAIGTSATHASNGQLRASATFTTPNAPTLFGLAAALDDPALTAPTDYFLTVGTADLPTSGTLIVDMFFASAN